MKSRPGRVASEYSKIDDRPSYSLVAAEYYDERLHPTCADFRLASRIYLERLLAEENLSGRVADIGCGKSLLLEVSSPTFNFELILVDESDEMLAQNRPHHFEVRKIDVETAPFGHSEFNWAFAVLADPYNTLPAWNNINRSLQPRGKCVFLVPSFVWATKFRSKDARERPGFARFPIASGREVFLPSLIRSPVEQRTLIESAGLRIIATGHLSVDSLPVVRSPKISDYLTGGDPIIDVYWVEK